MLTSPHDGRGPVFDLLASVLSVLFFCACTHPYSSSSPEDGSIPSVSMMFWRLWTKTSIMWFASTCFCGKEDRWAPLKRRLTPPKPGRDSIHNTRMWGKPRDHSASTLLKKTKDHVMSLRVPTLVKDSLSDVGQLTTRDWIRVMMTFFALHWMFVYINITSTSLLKK